MSKNVIFFIAIILSCSCIFASGNYRNATLAQIASYRDSYNPEYKEWVEIECVNIDQISGKEISAYTDKHHRYLTIQNDTMPYLCEFKGHRHIAELKDENYMIDMKDILENDMPYLISEKDLYLLSNPERGNTWYCLSKYDIKTGAQKERYQIEEDNLLEREKLEPLPERGVLFMIRKDMYYLALDGSGKCYQLVMEKPENPEDSGILTYTEFTLTNVPASDTSIVVFEDKLYYFSDSGLCIATIKGTEAEEELASDVEVTSPTSVFLTDGPHKMWILNPTDGVVAWDMRKHEAKKIAEFPKATSRGTEAFFCEAEFLYYIDSATEKAYALDTHEKHKKEPRRPWGAPRIPFIEGGYEFKGLAEFFAMLHEYYLSIMCNGMPMMFLFDPRMCAFHLAPKAPAFDPARFNDAFMDDKYFYVYNPESNTITCTDVATGMAKEIGCYDDMPEDIIQIVFANNCFFILTKSGENHIARMAGPKLKYVTTWKLDDWTPRTGATVVAVGHAIYVFGGKELSDSKEESSSKCYSDLYIYDFRIGSSEKLEADADVTARYNAKMLINKHFGRIWIIGGKDESDATAADIWEFNTRNKVWTYINDLPTEEGNASGCYDEDTDTMSVLVTPEPEEETDEVNVFSSRSTTREITRASSGVAVYELKDLAGANDLPDQSGKSCCGCLGLEFLLAMAGLFFFRRCRK